MSKRTTYTTEHIRADDLKTADVARIDGTWSFVSDVYGWADLEAAADEFEADPDTYRKIAHIVNKVPENDEGVYVAVRYLYTNVSHTGGAGGHRYSPHEPSYQIAAYSQYELVEIQKEESK